MIFYTERITPRFRYIADFIGTELTGSTPVITSDKTAFQAFQGIRVSYSNERLENAIWIKPHDLLFRVGVQQKQLQVVNRNGITVLFPGDGDTGFDLLAAAFYLLSRYEEYLPYVPDQYGRYPHTASLAFREQFLQVPLIDHWLQDLRLLVKQHFTAYPVREPQFSFVPTYDIDEAYSYRYKSAFRSLGGTVRSLLHGRWNEIGRRIRARKKLEPDPYDSFAWMDGLHDRYHLKPIYFFLLAGKTGQFDKNIPPTHTAMQALIRAHAARYRVGIHPSWQSGNDKQLLREEIQMLASLTEQPVTISRQHFIRMTLPDTYRNLTDAGIREDFSMGYGSVNGFRASVSVPFYWYDLKAEAPTPLVIHPFCFMDANSFFEQRQSPEETLLEISSYYYTLRSVNGRMVTLWHNTFLGTDPRFAGWREVYESIIKEISA